jgi:WD40 repeat protein
MNANDSPAKHVVVDAENPWPGLDYFAEQSQAFFHGREAESDLLLSMVRHRVLTVLYGQSGLGKSSLLQAGLFPRLRADGWLPVYIRLSHTDADGLGGQGPTALIRQTHQFIREAIADAVDGGQLIAETGNGPEAFAMPRDNESLWEYLHRRDLGLRSVTSNRVAPVLVFDQFEEIFTLGRSEARRAIRQTFLRDLSDCVENRLPESILKEMNQRDPTATDSYAHLDFTRQDYRIVLSLREDYLAELHDLDELIPSIHENETRLLPLNGWQALDAIAIPGETLVEPVVAREVVELVAASRRGDANGDGAAAAANNGEFTDESQLQVDPALLSMVCRELNAERQRRKEPKITEGIVDDLLRNSGRSILRGFYADCFKALPERESAAEVQKFVEDELLTPNGYRNMAELERAQHRLNRAGVKNPGAALQQLVDERLLRINERPQDKTRWLELTHDVLCDVVKESRREREVREAKERKEREESELAARRLQEAERQRAEAEEQAKQAQQREAVALERITQMRRARRFGIALLVLTICFAGVLCVAGYLARARIRTGAQAQERSRAILGHAKARIARTDDDRHKVQALRLLARTLRFDPTNAEAARLLSELLMTNDWMPPLSQPLSYPDGALFCAAITPDDRELVAVAQDGNLVRWNTTDFTPVPHMPLAPDKSKSPEVVSSAAFSRDGKRLLVTLSPPGRENARVYEWSDQDRTYRSNGTTVEYQESIRSIAWSADGASLFILPMRFDQATCRVFRLDGKSYKQQTTIPNTTVAELSPDNRWLAVGAPGGNVQFLDARTLQPAPADSGLQPSLVPAEPNVETRYYSFSFSHDGEALAATAVREPVRVWDVRGGDAQVIRPRSARDRVLRVAFAPAGTGGRALVLAMAGTGGGMLNVIDTAAGKMRSEPIVIADQGFIVPSFRADGKALITLSGASWQGMDALRVWDLALPKARPDAADLRFTGKSAPRWLPEIADAVAGVRPLGDDNETPVPTLRELPQKYAGQKRAREYEPLWERFVGSRP